MRIFGIDPGSERTGYGCVETDGRRHRLIVCGSLSASAGASFPDKLQCIHDGLSSLLAEHQPSCVAIENIFHAKNVRSALRLGHARGVALLAAASAGVPIAEYTPAEIKRAVVGFGRAEKQQVGQMVKLLLGLETIPSPHDAADALAIAICHVHSTGGAVADAVARASQARNVGRTSQVPKVERTSQVPKVERTSEVPKVERTSEVPNVGRTSQVRHVGRTSQVRLTSWRHYRP